MLKKKELRFQHMYFGEQIQAITLSFLKARWLSILREQERKLYHLLSLSLQDSHNITPTTFY